MTQNLLIRTVFQGISGLPTDQYTNDFALVIDGPADQTLCNGIATDLAVEFYNFVDSLGQSLANPWLSPDIDRGTDKVDVLMYDVTGHLDGSPAGSPIFASTFTLSAAGGGTSGQGLPAEVALALSIHADDTGLVEVSGSTRPKARRRGRIFIGPLAGPVRATSATGIRPNFDFITNLVEAAGNLLATWDDPADHGEWQVWSRKAAAMHPVIGGWIDNAFDTQRRRGNPANGRTLW